MSDTTRDLIIGAARRLFFTAGFSKVTIDEVARDLGVSKKTIYKHFPGKQELIAEAVRRARNEFKADTDAVLMQDDLPFMEKMHRFLEQIGKFASRNLDKAILQDLQRTAPEVWLELEAFRRQQIQSKFRKFFEEGKQQGVLKPDVNLDVLVLIYLHSVQNIIHPNALAELPLTSSEAIQAIFKTILEGVLAPEVRESTNAMKPNKSGKEGHS